MMFVMAMENAQLVATQRYVYAMMVSMEMIVALVSIDFIQFNLQNVLVLLLVLIMESVYIIRLPTKPSVYVLMIIMDWRANIVCCIFTFN